MTTAPIEFRITVRWPAGDVRPADAMKALLKVLGRRFNARCVKCSVAAEDQAIPIDESTGAAA